MQQILGIVCIDKVESKYLRSAHRNVKYILILHFLKGLTMVLVFGLLTIITGCNSDSDSSNMESFSKEEMREYISKEINVGCSKEKVIDFLQKNNIAFSEANMFDKSPIGETNVEWILASIQQKSLIYRNKKLMLEFYFDKTNHKLIRYEVKYNW